MPRLLLLRHGKSGYPAGVEDIDRPLAPRGREAAARMGEAIRAAGLIPDLALVSPARRARETFELVRPVLGGIVAREEPSIYEATSRTLLALVQGTGPEIGTLLLVGHNPAFEDLARLLSGDGDPDAFDRLRQKFPTAALAVISGEAWSGFGPGRGRLERFLTPKSLDGGAER